MQCTPRPVRQAFPPDTIVARHTHRIGSAIFTLMLCLFTTPALAQAPEEHSAEVPADMEILSSTRSGVYYIAKPLKEKRDQLHEELRLLSKEIDSAELTREDAEKRLTELTTKLDALDRDIETQKVLAAPVKEYEVEEKTEFELGPEKLLVITADDVEIIGWDKPHVECTLKKIILAPPGTNVDSDAQGLKVVHKHGRARDLVGRSDEEVAADEKEFLASPDGQKLTPEQRENRAKFVKEIADSWRPYQRFQGRDIDSVEIEGLTHEQGNRQISLKTSSSGGGMQMGSTWKRHASLTIRVPKCQAVLLRGCRVHLDVTEVHADLRVTESGSHDIDYDGTFAVRDVVGSLHVDSVPVQVVENVQGDVEVIVTRETTNSGTTHQNDWRLAYTPEPARCVIRKVSGALLGRFLRSDVAISEVAGRIDVENDFGETALLAVALSPVAHRITSESGRIQATLGQEDVKSLLLHALTSCGSVRTSVSQGQMEDFSISGTIEGRERYGVRGFATKPGTADGGFNPDSFFMRLQRIQAILTGEPREPGLDLFSRGGSVVVDVLK